MRILFEVDTEGKDIEQKIRELKEIERIVEERTAEILVSRKREFIEAGSAWLNSRAEKSF